jgi:N6-adenosine-specific RNA methylase IME4
MRNRRSKPSVVASASYYLGYVEEDESPEAIMAKFAELERIQKQNSLNPNESLTEDQMKELFQKTSTFSVDKVVAGDDEWDEWWEEDLTEFDEEQEEQDNQLQSEKEPEDEELTESEPEMLENAPEQPKAEKKQRSTKRILSTASKTINYSVPTVQVRQADEIEILRLPMPIGPTWAHLIRHSKTEQTSSQSWEKSQILALLIDVPSVKHLQSIVIDNYIVRGFLFIWCNDKSEIGLLFDFAHSFGFKYCENICWIRMTLENKLATKQSTWVNECKTSCFAFRKFKDSEMELRHQRNSDCIFDWERTDGSKPAQVYSIVETLLPVKQQEQVVFLELAAKQMNNSKCFSNKWAKVFV